MSDDHASFKIRGKSHTMAGAAFRNGSVNTEEMKVKWIVFTNKSLVHATIYSDSLLQATIVGDGNVICKGQPPLIEYQHLSGKGTLLTP